MSLTNSIISIEMLFQAIEVTKSPSWKCPKCIEEEIYAKKEKLKAKTMQIKKLSIEKPQNPTRKLVKPKPSQKKSINILEASDSSSDSLSNDEAKEKPQKAKKKLVKPQPLKKKSIKIIQDSDSSSNSLSIDESKENPHKGVKKLVKPKPSRKKSMKLIQDSDSSSDSSSNDEAGKIIRIPVDKSELHEYYR